MVYKRRTFLFFKAIKIYKDCIKYVIYYYLDSELLYIKIDLLWKYFTLII